MKATATSKMFEKVIYFYTCIFMYKGIIIKILCSIPGGGKEDFSSNLCDQTGSGAHPTSCPMGTGGPFPWE
jgi:hypothetical protein